jgi:hypothetical protein
VTVSTVIVSTVTVSIVTLINIMTHSKMTLNVTKLVTTTCDKDT